MSATKYDTDKIDPSFVSWGLAAAVSRSMGLGAKKYERDNYRSGTGLKVRRIVGALVRHALALLNGQRVDPESGLHHADHIAANANMLCETLRLFPGNDDLGRDWLAGPETSSAPEIPPVRTVQVDHGAHVIDRGPRPLDMP